VTVRGETGTRALPGAVALGAIAVLVVVAAAV
jgi:hypothetical protein